MYCGDCSAAVDELDPSCWNCGAEFADRPAERPVDESAIAAVWDEQQYVHERGDAAPLAEARFDENQYFEDSYDIDSFERDPSGGFATDANWFELGEPGRRRPILVGAAIATIVTLGVIAYVVRGAATTTSSRSPAATTTPVNGGPLPQVATTSTPAAGASATTPRVAPTTNLPSSATDPATVGGAPSTSVAVAVEGPSLTIPPTAVATTTTVGTTTVSTTTAGDPDTVPAATATIAPTPTASTTPSSTTPSNTIAAQLSAIRGSSVRADNEDSCGTPTSYQPLMAVDGHSDTAWMVNGDGTDASLTLTMKQPITIASVGLIPGYAKRDACSGADRFLQTRRLLEVRWTFDGADSLTETFDPASETMQSVALPAPIRATTVTITVVRTTSPGRPPLDYTAIAEVAVN